MDSISPALSPLQTHAVYTHENINNITDDFVSK